VVENVHEWIFNGISPKFADLIHNKGAMGFLLAAIGWGLKQ
jgi:hypothetical protein